MEKKKEHIVLQIMNIIKLQHKNATNLIRIEEYLGKGGFVPIVNNFGYEYNLDRTTCYDEKVEIISINE